MQKENKMYRKNLKVVGFVLLIVAAICSIVIFSNGGNYEQYLGQTEIFNCMDIEEYGPDGNEEGVLKRTVTETIDYKQVYGLFFHTFYMKDEVSAQSKFDKLVKEINFQSQDPKVSESGVKVASMMDDENVYYVVGDGHTVYKAFGEKETISRNQKWFNVLRLDYKVPY